MGSSTLSSGSCGLRLTPVIPADTGKDGLDLPFADSAGGGVNALTITHGGTANVGAFYLRNATGAGSAVFASSNGIGASIDGRATGTGRAGHFQVLNASNNRPAVDAYTTGTGQAGWFGVNNASNSGPALEGTTNGTGSALKATNTGTGRAGEFNGNVHITGTLTKTYGTSTFNISPVAFGIIDENGVIKKGSPNVVSCVYDTTDREFEVAFSGLTYNASDFITSVTCIGTFYTIPNTAGYFTTTGSENGKLRVQIATPSDGGYIPGKRPFSFIIYQP